MPLPGEAWYEVVNSWCGRLRHLGRTDGEAWARVLELAPGLSDWGTRRDFGDGCADREAHLRHRFETCWADAKRDFEPATEGIRFDPGRKGSAPAAEPEAPWPAPLALEAYHGLAGRFVEAVAPYSEADPAAILLQALSMFGCLVGPDVHADAGDAPHPARLDVLTVGPTGKGRKDTAGRPARRLVSLADPAFASRIVEGLSSGEGVIWAVRDPVEKTVMVGKGAERHPELQIIDEGVLDKRLLVRESEFAQALRVSQRDGNILSPVVRRAWESGELRTLTRNNPVTATGAHVVITGNITRDELLRYLDRTEVASGFMNRFLLCAARRAQVLPDGEGVPDAALAPLADELRDVVDWAKEPRLLRRDDVARGMWHAVYEQLSEGAPGLLGAATNRAEAQVLRLSVLYAILDRSEAHRRRAPPRGARGLEVCRGLRALGLRRRAGRPHRRRHPGCPAHPRQPDADRHRGALRTARRAHPHRARARHPRGTPSHPAHPGGERRPTRRDLARGVNGDADLRLSVGRSAR